MEITFTGRSLLLSFAAAFLWFTASSQTVKFEHYAVDDGLPQSVLLAVFQDSEGFIWLGTQCGLSRFDGYTFLNFFNDPLNSASLSNNWIYDIAEDAAGIIYLATKGGLNKYDKKTGNFSVIDFTDPDSPPGSKCIYGIIARDSVLYINTPPVLTIHNTLTGKSESYCNNYEPDGNVYDLGSPILPGRDNRIWIASHQGLSCFDLQMKKFLDISESGGSDEITRNTNITCLFEEKNGNILTGTQNGLFLINGITREISALEDIGRKLGSPFIRAITRVREGHLWIATEGGGLHKMDLDADYQPRSFRHYRSGQGFISHDIVYSLYLDHSENLWIGTLAGLDKMDLKKSGISIIASSGDPESFDILDNIIASVYKDQSGRLWIGNWGKGLNILSSATDRDHILHYTFEQKGKMHIPENNVHVIFEDSSGRIYIGTRNGISVYLEDEGSFVPLHKFFNNPAFDCFNNIRVYCMIEDRTGKFWVGTGNGIVIIDPGPDKIKTLRKDSPAGSRLNSNLVYSIMEDLDGEIWIATSEGVNIYDREKDTLYSITNEPSSLNTLCSNFTLSLFQDNLGYIWIGTGSGLNRYSREDSIFIYYSRAKGLPSEIIYDIIGDASHHLWFTTGGGVVTLDPAEAPDGRLTVIDPLKGQEFNIKAVYRSEDGELFFGGMNGLFSFYPDSLRKNRYIPPVRITSLEKENDGIRQSVNTYQNKINLSYRDYSFTIEFSALDYTFSSKNRYSFRMEGLSDNWIDLGEQRFVHFTNLSPGTYTFMVKGSNSDGLWNEESSALMIYISPPWWASVYAYTSYLILFLALIVFIIYYRERALKREKRMLEIEVDHRTAEIARQKKQVEESEQKLRSTINSLDDIVFVLDEKGHLQEFYNPAHRNTHFIFPEQDLGKHFTEINFPAEVNEHFKNAYEAFSTKSGILEFDHQFRGQKKIFWYNTKLSPKLDIDGKLTGLVVVSREITDRKESEELLTSQKEKLDELNITKDKFFSILAHDLKNPFANLYSMSEVLVKNYQLLDETDKFEAMEKIHKASGFIYELLENLLTWSLSQRGKIPFQPGPFDLLNLIEININLTKLQAEKKGIRMVNEMKNNLRAYGDKDMIHAVLRNLLTNALKFSSDGGKVSISVQEEKDHFIISIRDDGVGISPEDQRKLFALEEKYRSVGTSGETGTGLGLILCLEFIKKHGGRIWCESEEGSGSVFSFTLGKEV